MLKNISYLLCSVFLCTFSLIAVADDPIPEVTVIGKTGDGNGSFLTGRGAQEYLAWATAQAAPSNAQSGGTSTTSGKVDRTPDTKAKCEARNEVADRQCKNDGNTKYKSDSGVCSNYILAGELALAGAIAPGYAGKAAAAAGAFLLAKGENCKVDATFAYNNYLNACEAAQSSRAKQCPAN